MKGKFRYSLPGCLNFVWKKSVGKWETKTFQKMQEAVAQLNREYMQGFHVEESTRAEDLQRICRFLEKTCKEQETAFVHGRGWRKSKNQKYLELFRQFQECQTAYDWHNASFQGRNNYCKTDPDTTFMHMKDDHMRNAQLKPGYNVQKYIVATEIFQNRNDVWTLMSFLEGMEKNLNFRYPSITANSGHENEEGYTYLSGKRQTPYIKPQIYEQRKKSSFKKDISKREHMGHDERTDTYTCHAGKS